jgi:hypothetical protein
MPRLRARMSDRGSRVGETPVRAAVAACRRCGTLSGVSACPLQHSTLPFPASLTFDPTIGATFVVSVVPAYSVPFRATTPVVANMSTTAIANAGGPFTPTGELKCGYADVRVMPMSGRSSAQIGLIAA